MLSALLLVGVTIFLAAPCTCGTDLRILFLLISGQEKVKLNLKSNYVHSGTSLMWAPLGRKYLSGLVRCPYFRRRILCVYVKVGTESSVLIK